MLCMNRAGVALVVLASVAVGAARADIGLFEDDFSSGTLNPAKWTALVDPGCSLTVGADNVLHSYFTGAAAPRGAYAQSVAIGLPTAWTSVTLSGQWAFVDKVYGEMVINVFDPDQTSNYLRVSYRTYGGDAFQAQQTGMSAVTTVRSTPSTLSDFELILTPGHWTFRELRDATWTTLADYDAAFLGNLAGLQFKIGGWEYSFTTLQRVDFDNILVQAVPEPATLSLVGLGVAGLTIFRRRA
jgi:hypothetical protein